MKDKDLNIDKTLIKSFLSGNEDAFEELFKRHSLNAYKISMGLLSNKADAEEVVQDAFLKVYKNLAKFRGDASFTTWFYRIITNLSRNKYHWHRRRGADVNVSLSVNSNSKDGNRQDFEIPDSKFEPDKILENKELEMKLMELIKKLPEQLREVLILRHLKDFSYAKIAKILDCKLGTVKSRLSRARKELITEYKNS